MNRREAIKRAALLSGYAITASAMTGILHSCESASTPAEIWKPTLFNQDDFISFAEITETILPRTEIPGAKDLGVDRFLDHFYKNVKKEEYQQLMLKGVEQANADCQAVYGHRFEDCTPSEKTSLLKRYAELNMLKKEGSPNSEVVNMGKFFSELRKSAVFAYCTTKEIATEQLHYEPIPGKYQGCIELSELKGRNHAKDS